MRLNFFLLCFLFVVAVGSSRKQFYLNSEMSENSCNNPSIPIKSEPFYCLSTPSYGQNAMQDVYHYMMNRGEIRRLPDKKDIIYLSSDKKVAAITGNTIVAKGYGDCMIYSVYDDKQTFYARVSVDWQIQNPVLPYEWRMYVPDPEAHSFGGSIYIYGSLDIGEGGFCSPYYVSLTSPDLKQWESHGYSFSSFDEGVPRQGKVLWDSDGANYGDNYQLYGFFQPPNLEVGNNETDMFVLESQSPMGKFTNFKWITGNKSGENVQGCSAQIFIDDDEKRYILYAPGVGNPTIAQLTDHHIIDESTVTSLAAYTPDFFEAPSLRKHGDTYYLIYAENCGPLSPDNATPKRLSYATSKHILKDYVYRGTIISVEGFHGAGNIQGSIEPVKAENGDANWYVFYHRPMNGVWNKRSLCIEKIGFDEKGLIIPPVLTSSGVSDGFDPFRPIYFNTAVIFENCKLSDKGGRYGGLSLKGSAATGFRYLMFTGKEKRATIKGSALKKIKTIRLLSNGKAIGEITPAKDSTADGQITIPVQTEGGKATLLLEISSDEEIFLETVTFS